MAQTTVTGETKTMKRIQRKRVKGWRMQPNTVYVGRPSKWGNPYKVGELGIQTCLSKYRGWLNEQLFADPDFLEPLKNKDLACWCSLTQPCHVDILLEFLKALYGGD